MSDFDLRVKAAAEQAVLQFIGSGGWLLPNYESRLKIPAEWIADCWHLVDADSLKRKIAARIESEMLRGLAREHMDAVMQAGAAHGN